MDAIYTINEVKSVDTYTGGNTKIVTIGQNGFIEVPDDQQIKIYKDAIQNISEYLANSLFKDEKLKQEFKGMLTKIYPK